MLEYGDYPTAPVDFPSSTATQLNSSLYVKIPPRLEHAAEVLETCSPTVKETFWGQALLRYVVLTASGASTVAIDNKIEQAMDLVKSHLMYAVREEVEVLKEQIKELLEKNTQLEYELNILKAAATPETLAKLQQPRHPQPPTSTS